MSEIARDIEKPPATVYSYLLHHGGIRPRARIRRASSLSFDERETISLGLASGCSILTIAKELVMDKLASDWSPQQIAGWLKHYGPGGKDMYVSHQTIYKSLFISIRSLAATTGIHGFTRAERSGAVPIDNNYLENRIRPIAQGRRSWLFAEPVNKTV